MGIVSAKHRVSLSTSDAAPGGASYTESWIVILTATPTSALEARQAAGGDPQPIPDTGDAHWDDAASGVVSVNAKPLNNEQTKWIVTANYEPPSGFTLAANPLLDPVQKAWGFNVFSRVPKEDKDGTKILNTAGDRFDPSPEIEDYRLTLAIIRNEASFNGVTAESFIGTVNDASITLVGSTFAARKARMTQYSGVFRTRNGVDFWEVTYGIIFNDDTWDLDILNYGVRETTGTAPNTYKITVRDSEGREVGIPWPLDADGVAQDPDAAPLYQTFKVFAESNFSALSLPTT